MKKYSGLTKYLKSELENGHRTIALSFQQLETIIDATLPESAFSQFQWWDNTESNQHGQMKAWRAARFIVKAVDFTTQTVRFEAITE